jgi:signal peptidase
VLYYIYLKEDNNWQLLEMTYMAFYPILIDSAKESKYTKESIRDGTQRGVFAKRAVSIVFYGLLVLLVIAVFLYSNNGKKSRQLFGFSIFTVLTKSMQNELPQGSLIIVHRIDPTLLEIGDDITYLPPEGPPVTHRIIEIEENADRAGARGFRTQGISNLTPDPDLVFAPNVLGRVIFHVEKLGIVLQVIRENLILSAVIGVLLLGLFETMRILLQKSSYQIN